MITFKRLINPSFLYLLGLLLSATLFLNSCGGGAAAVAGVGSGGTGVVGMITGFGSVIFDNVNKYSVSSTTTINDDTSAQTGIPSILNVGQVGRAIVDAKNIVTSIDVTPQLQGPITSAPTLLSSLSSSCLNKVDGNYCLGVLNQEVHIVTNPSSSQFGTIFYNATSANTTLTTLSSGNEIRVYGLWKFDGSAYYLEATRIELYYAGQSYGTQAKSYTLSGYVSAVSQNNLTINNLVNISESPMPSWTSTSLNTLVSMNLSNTVPVLLTSDPNSVASVSNLKQYTIASLVQQDTSYLDVNGYISYLHDNGNGTATAIIQGNSVTVSSSKYKIGDYVRLYGDNLSGELVNANDSKTLSSNGPISLSGVVNLSTLLSPTNPLVVDGTLVNINNQTSITGCSNSGIQSVVVNASYNGSQIFANSITCTQTNQALNSDNNLLVELVGMADNNISTTVGTNFSFTVNTNQYTVTVGQSTYTKGIKGSGCYEVRGILSSGSTVTTQQISATSIIYKGSSCSSETPSSYND